VIFSMLAAAALVAVPLSSSATARRSRSPAAVPDAADASGPLDLSFAGLTPRLGKLVLTAGTRGTWAPEELQPFPDPTDRSARSLCLRVSQTSGESQLCVGPPGPHNSTALGFSALDADGRPVAGSQRAVPAKVTKLDAGTVRAAFKPRAAGVNPTSGFDWFVQTNWSGPECPSSIASGPPCSDRLPDGTATIHIGSTATAMPTGCTRPRSPLHTHGPRGKKEIAIGFDDGPSSFTPQVLRVLRRFDSHATFFEIGQETSGRADVMRSVLAQGNEIGNHSLHHETDPSAGSLSETNHLIRSATGFEPCEFRPPDGVSNGALVSRADNEGLNTIIWDVDPRDWSTPGVGAIKANVIHNAHNGSIIVMHDGGGPRGQTVAALPAILSHFKRRGFKFVTVTELLGQQFTY
jgi:peptidoglycan/xylan/chitin deacetylase (PgdA/CDA1 family)